MNTLVIKDEAASGKVLNEIALKFENEYISVKELIAKRIENEVDRYQNDLASYKTKGLVLPTDLEKRLNKKQTKQIDVEKQIYVALNAFNNNGFFILIDDEQVDDLDQKFLVDELTKVSFVKLTPLVGG
jgi:hypothetical protein